MPGDAYMSAHFVEVGPGARTSPVTPFTNMV